MRYPHIMRACTEIAYDNNGINRTRPEAEQRAQCAKWLEKFPPEKLADYDHWLSTLSEEELDTVCTGEETERDMLFESAPLEADYFFDSYFNEVC